MATNAPHRHSGSPELPGARIRLVVGLGNPGSNYVGTRHNVGFDLVERLASARGLDWRLEKKWKIELARTSDHGLIFAKPQTYMNLSGEAVIRVCSYFKIPPAELLVVYDDVDLPLGRLRLRASGSAGGHNGVKSLIQHLGTDAFPRLKFGIGRNAPESQESRREMVGHVLGRFSPEEIESLEKNMAHAAEAVNCALSTGLAPAMNRFNQNPSTAPRPKQPTASLKKSQDSELEPESSPAENHPDPDSAQVSGKPDSASDPSQPHPL